MLGGCAVSSGGPGGRSEPPPPVDLYGEVPDFTGVWLGEIGGQMGELGVSKLGDTRYYGSFKSDDGAIRFVLNMKQRTAPDNSGQATPGNLVTFDWQDGQQGDVCSAQGCGQGKGWVLINPEDTALSGMLGFGESNANRGTMSFVRVEDTPE